MKKISIFFVILSFLFTGCQNVSRKYVKDAQGAIEVTSTYPNGTSSVSTYTHTTVKTLNDLGLSENSAVNLIANGTPAQSISREPTMLGVVVIVIVIIIIVIIAIASGNGEVIGDIFDD